MTTLTTLPVRASDSREQRLEETIAKLRAEQRPLSDEEHRLTCETNELQGSARAAVFSGKPRERAAIRQALDEKQARLDVVRARLAEVNDALQEAEPARARVRAEVDAAIGGQLRAEAERVAKKIDVALTQLVAAVSDGQALAEHADRQLSDEAGLYRGARAGLSTNALGVLLAFGDIDAQWVASWRREAIAQRLL
jgi:chromosome segregation ATPase